MLYRLNRVRLTRWHIALIITLVIAGVPRLLTYSYSLPYIDWVDEPNFYWKAQAWLGLYDQGGLAGYPPGVILTDIATQKVLGVSGLLGMVPTIQAVRLLAVIATLFALVFAAWTARLMVGDVAGIMAGLAWGLSPLVMEHTSLATADPFVYMLMALTLWLAVGATDDKRGYWSVLSVGIGLIATLFKYPVAVAILPGGLVALAIFVRNRRKGLTYLIVQAAMVIAVLVFLLVIYKAQRMTEIGRGMDGSVERISRLASFFQPADILNNMYYGVYGLIPAAFVITSVLGVIALVAIKPLNRTLLGQLALCVVLFASITWFSSTFMVVNLISRIRDVLPATPVAAVIFGVAVGLMVKVAEGRWQQVGRLVPLALIGALVFVPQAFGILGVVQDRTREDWRVLLRHWADKSLEPGKFLVGYENYRTFNPHYGGIDYRHWFDWWQGSIIENPLPVWRDQIGVSYVAIARNQWEELRNSDKGRAYLDNMLHLRDFTAPPSRRGDEVVVYRLRKMDVETQLPLGDSFVLMGYDRSAEQVAPGNAVTLRFYWQAARKPPINYSMFIHLYSANGEQLVGQADGSPGMPDRPTVTWDSPTETVISPAFDLNVPRDLAPGKYRVVVGLYDSVTGQRLITPSGADHLELFTLAVT